MSKLPTKRPSRVVIEPVAPIIDGGIFAAKAALGEPVTVIADVFGDGHDAVDAALRWRAISPAGRGGKWTEVAMQFDGNDRWHATFTPTQLGRHEYEVIGWSNHAETWRHGTQRKVDADVDVSVELLGGQALVAGLLANAGAAKPRDKAAVARLEAWLAELAEGDTTSLGADWSDVFWRYVDREPVATSGSLPVDVDPERARFSAWYEFFPRSAIAPAAGHATLRDAIDRLDYVAELGFDVLYLPPIHPIGKVNRKGANNATTAGPDDVGSPWGIADHLAVHPELGTIADVQALGAACRQRGIELAIDIAFQCTPDHPWVSEHPEWFAHRADGSIQYAENPPKKYQDIYPIDFESSDWKALWQGLADVIRFWIDQGITIFRVDNPHTKAFPFWEWAIGSIRIDHPDTIFLAEAFTRPRVMERLAKVGFNQSYTYFTWRREAWELREYFTDLATRTVDSYRPNAWPNTPDILTEQLQYGGRAMFVNRTILAATLSANWGIYGPAFELLEHHAAKPGSEEYLDSEKYQLRTWQLDHPDSIAPLITRLNEIRRSQPALQHLRTLRFHDTDAANLLCYSKTDPLGVGDPILVVVNVDTHHRHAGLVHVDPSTFGIGLGDDDEFEVHDLLGGGVYRWRGWHNFVDLTPGRGPAHVFAVRRIPAAAPPDTTVGTTVGTTGAAVV
ncbi:MAG TPA: alpha-1,4-glucan--maltose-1-phosphate maltosyltransferase [Ilumatobacter sp.]|nr:alpha-1,4-glucan--maltose-1-phosphate maltosyltransferase [Ilumatobacter sp.]